MARERCACLLAAAAAAVLLAAPLPGSARAQEETEAPATPPVPTTSSPEDEARVRKTVDQARADLATRARGPTMARAQADWGKRLAALGPAAVPAVASALGREDDAAVAAALEQALLAYPSLVPAGVLVDAGGTRRLAATPSLVRAAGSFGGEPGARLALALLDESDLEAKQLEAKFTNEAPARLEALRALRNAAVDALGAGEAFAPGLERLLALLEGTARQPRLAGPDADRVREAVSLALRRGIDGQPRGEGEGGAPAAAAAPPAVAAALRRASGPVLVALLEAAAGARVSGLVDAAGRAITEAEATPHDAGTRAALRNAAAAALRPYVVASDGPAADPAAIAHHLRLLSADDEALRLSVVLDLGFTKSSAVLPRLVDAYESDPSQDVRTQAHASLVRLAGGANLGDPDDWREWYGGRR